MLSSTGTAPTVDALGAAERIRAWGEARDWRGWDPYDGLTSPFAPVLTLRKPLGRRVLTQVVKRSPLNLRPVLGIRPSWNHKAIGLVASAYVNLATLGDESARAQAGRRLDWLEESRVGPKDTAAWAYPFDVQTRFFFYPAHSPNTIATCFAAHAFLDAAELLGDERRLETAKGAVRFLVHTMRVEGEGKAFFRYVPEDRKLIHNANLLACSVIHRAARLSGSGEHADLVAEAVATSLSAERPDGSWPYSDWDSQGWVDNFHTGFVLEALAHCRDLPGVEEALARGAAYWRRELFLPDGTPKYYPDRAEPLDAHCYATAVDTFVAIADDAAVGDAERVAHLLIRDMLNADGSVVFQRAGRVVNRVPFVRWTAAPSFRGLARLALAQRAAS